MLPIPTELVDSLRLDHETGVLVWAIMPKKYIKVGSVAGTVDGHGYVCIGFKKKRYFAHRVVWRMHHGMDAAGILDHRNRSRADNRPCNLREVSYAENRDNSKVSKNNTSGFRGVYWSPRHRKYVAHIRVTGVLHNLGYYATAEEASSKYQVAREKRFPSTNQKGYQNELYSTI